MSGAGCGPGDAQCMGRAVGRAVGQVMHNVWGGL